MSDERDWGDELDEEQIERLEKAVFDGNAYAGWELMQIYGGGSENEMDGALRVERLLPLCERGYAEARRTLAQMYQRGDGIPKIWSKPSIGTGNRRSWGMRTLNANWLICTTRASVRNHNIPRAESREQIITQI